MVNIQRNFGAPHRQLNRRSLQRLQCDNKIRQTDTRQLPFFPLPPTLINPTLTQRRKRFKHSGKTFITRDHALRVLFLDYQRPSRWFTAQHALCEGQFASNTPLATPSLRPVSSVVRSVPLASVETFARPRYSGHA